MPTVNLDTASRLDIVCRKGDTFQLTIDFGTSLTSYEGLNFKLQVRDSDTASDIILGNDGSTATDHTLRGFVIDGSELTINMPNSTMDEDGGEYVYDLQSVKEGAVKTWLHGYFTIIEDITE